MKRFSLFSLAGDFGYRKPNYGLLASLLLSGLIFLPPAFSQSNTTETLTISTYYPSPYGVYNELRLYPKTSPTTCDSLTEGNMYYNSTTDEVMVCKGIGGSYNWQSMSGLWTLSGTKLYPNDSVWNVGIGTTSPAEKLHVGGNIYTPYSMKVGNLSVVNSAFSAWGLKGTVAMGYDNGYAVGFGQNAFGETGMGISSTGPTPAGAFYINPTVSELRLKAYYGRSFNFLTSSGVSPDYSRLYIANTGNVGIGTTSPAEELHVNGNVFVQGNVYKSGNLGVVNSALSLWLATGGLVSGFNDGYTMAMGRVASGEFGVGGGLPWDMFFALYGGGPDGMTHLASWNGRPLNIYIDKSWGVRGAEMIFRGDNVGIGTIWPSKKLDVAGIGKFGRFYIGDTQYGVYAPGVGTDGWNVGVVTEGGFMS